MHSYIIRLHAELCGVILRVLGMLTVQLYNVLLLRLISRSPLQDHTHEAYPRYGVG